MSFSLSSLSALAERREAKENRCSGISVFETAKKIFHKNPKNHAEASVIAGSTERGRAYSEDIFDACVAK
jgi:hypothetical protein